MTKELFKEFIKLIESLENSTIPGTRIYLNHDWVLDEKPAYLWSIDIDRKFPSIHITFPKTGKLTSDQEAKLLANLAVISIAIRADEKERYSKLVHEFYDRYEKEKQSNKTK